MKIWSLPLLVGTLVAVNLAVLTVHADTRQELEVQRSEVVEIRESKEDVSQRLAEVSKEKTSISKSYKKVEDQSKRLQRENADLKVELQAKKAAKLAASTPKPAARAQQASKPAPTVSFGGNKQSWLAASGIPANEWGYVDMIVSRESGWNPNAVNASSGACGLGQQLPCGKWAGAWNDPVAALRAQYGYVKERYGGYPQAVAFWNANHYY